VLFRFQTLFTPITSITLPYPNILDKRRFFDILQRFSGINPTNIPGGAPCAIRASLADYGRSTFSRACLPNRTEQLRLHPRIAVAATQRGERTHTIRGDLPPRARV